MSYFEELSDYTYHRGHEDAKNIGWLDSDYPYDIGEVSSMFINYLWNYLEYPVNVCRGFHTCNLCAQPSRGIPVVENNNEWRKVGYYEIRVLSNKGIVYAAPSMIWHYVVHHGYRPPQEFIDAVLSSNIAPGSKEYKEFLNKYDVIDSLDYTLWKEAEEWKNLSCQSCKDTLFRKADNFERLETNTEYVIPRTLCKCLKCGSYWEEYGSTYSEVSKEDMKKRYICMSSM